MDLGVTDATWGVNGPAFLLLYLTLVVVACVAAIRGRRQVLATPARAGAVTAQQAAYLNGGDRLAIYAALAALRSAGAVGVTPAPDRRLVATGPVPAGASPLDWAVHQAAGRRRRPRELATDVQVGSELARLHADLERAGLLPSADARRTIRTWTWLLLAVGGLGVARLFAGVANGRPVLFLIAILAALGVVVVILHRRRPWRTRAGDTVLADLRGRHDHLDPAHRPSWTSYGLAGAAMGVGIFGSEALWAADPAFAAEAEIERRFATATAASSSGAGGGGGCGTTAGGSCGGGGCGGGGCGGGGCGG